MKIDSKTAAIVTGGASGLGHATAGALAAAGARVTIFDLDSAKGEAVAAELGGAFARVDVTDEAATLAGFEHARAKHGQERILVNCAGGARGGKTVGRKRDSGDIQRHSMDDFAFTVGLNLIGTFRCITIAAAGMMTLDPLEGGERGVIANTASVAAQDGQIGQVAYSASKAGIVGMTLTIARDLSSEGIRINTILPGIMATPPMLGVPEKVLEGLAASVPFPKRLGHPEEFASLVLETVRNGYFNGQAIRLDGAIRMAPR
ncbi:SDR family NAD(P)-dependent oxidoreductase [Sphingomonas bacterium]|uniref:SDR family NAD(P)-dependent oxidoreductase n=1 Tax=Sphingomonas bacterium TaxID=1895847 RepID=UPI0015776BF7|nr:SDR family NAD(P)-dependent oxidoreductase [Sphingomonas bacterium]